MSSKQKNIDNKAIVPTLSHFYLAEMMKSFTSNANNNLQIIMGRLSELLQPSLAFYAYYDEGKKNLSFITKTQNTEIKRFETSVGGMFAFDIIVNSQKEDYLLFGVEELKPYFATDYLLKEYKFKTMAVCPVSTQGKQVALIASCYDEEKVLASDEIELFKSFASVARVEVQRSQELQALRQEKEKYKSIYDQVNDGIFILDERGQFSEVNEVSLNIFGCEKKDLISKSPVDFSPEMQPDGLSSREKANHLIKHTFEVGASRFYWKHKRKNDQLFDAEVSLSKAVHYGESFLLAVVRDITHQTQTEQKLTEAKLRAEESDKLKSAFLANMSHEIRTPLNSIIGFSELLLDEDTEQADKENFLNLISNAGKSLLQLIDDIIDISKIEAGQIKISKSKVEINGLLDEVKTTFDKEMEKRGKGLVKLILDKPLADNQLYLFTDPFRLRQILSNLLSNAIKFVDDGFVKFGYNGINDELIQFYIKDTGIGIEKDKSHLIFQRFGQVDHAYKRNLDGTGLGLAITKHLVELLDGKIWFDSEPDKGSTFYFTMPIEADFWGSSSENLLFGRMMNDWSNRVFLVVDDVEANFRFLKAVFRDTKALLLWAKSADDAIKICRNNNSITLVLMDIRMPEKDGNQAAKTIKGFAPNLPIIAQTAFADEADRLLALQSGCDDYISKPICKKELASLINKLVP
jgi:PAS domain S-box-containing protein